MFSAIFGECSKLDPKIALRCSVKEIIDVISSEGLIHIYLVSGVIPNLSALNTGQLSQEEHVTVLSYAKEETTLSTARRPYLSKIMVRKTSNSQNWYQPWEQRIGISEAP